MVTYFSRRLVYSAFFAILINFLILIFPPISFALACVEGEQPCNGGCISENNLCILEPVPGGATTLAPGQDFFYYINAGNISLWNWAFGLGIAIAVLNGVFGGLQIVMSNGDSGKVDAGKTRFLSSAIGLLILLLSGVILEFINPIGFQSS